MDQVAVDLVPVTRRDYQTRITPERSREMYALRMQKRAKREAEAETAKTKANEPAPLSPETSEYLSARLLRVRRQLDRVDELLLQENDPAKLDRLAAASMRLAEQERILAGRPLPGSLKPSAARSRRQSSSYAPVEPDPPATNTG